MNKIVRIATNNNFNCTKAEWDQLNDFALQHPGDVFFINSNINTPALSTVTKHPYKVVVTANPDITGTEADLKRIMKKIVLIKDHIAFVRVKFVPDISYFWEVLAPLVALNIPVVITLQRFNSLKSIAQFTDKKYYKYSCGRFRLTGKALTIITQLVARYQALKVPVWICDQAGTGCGGCGLCSKLVTGKQSLKIYSLNLSSSGICPYHCPDCYAKTMQNFCRKMGYQAIIYDVIKQNEKQSGRTAHIKEALRHAK
jgi:hypothetical protein